MTFAESKGTDIGYMWQDWTQLIGGATLVWYFDFETGEDKAMII